MLKVLFLDSDNSSLSQLAACCLERYGKNNFEVNSAGAVAGNLNLYALQVLEENHFDPFWLSTKSFNQVIGNDETFHFIISFLSKKETETILSAANFEKLLLWQVSTFQNRRESDTDELYDMKCNYKEIKEMTKEFVEESIAFYNMSDSALVFI